MAKYSPEPPPFPIEEKDREFYEWAFREFNRLATSQVGEANLNLEKTHVELARPQDGDIAYADGVDWNPNGTGEGIYAYLSGSWVKLNLAPTDDLTVDDLTVDTIRITGTGELDLSSTGHPFQIGPSNGANLAADTNEIQARNNGAAATLNLNPHGGETVIGTGATVATVLGTLSVTLVDNSSSGATITIFHDSSSPAPADIILRLIANGRDSATNVETYGLAYHFLIDATSGSEDSAWGIQTSVAGSRADRIGIGAGLYMVGSDGDPGAGLVAATGVRFNATQVASGNANTLDDYEEGDTTPTVTATVGTFTTVSCVLKYTKIGRVVYFDATVTITTAGTAAGGIVIPLPFSAVATACGVGREIAAVGFICSATISGASATVLKYDNTTIIASGRTVVVSGTYQV